MARRSLAYRRLIALEDERKSDQLASLAVKGRVEGIDMRNAHIPATAPEKIVLNFLDRLGIRWQFQYRARDNPLTMFNEDQYIRDFILPDFNITIEVFGSYWHSSPEDVTKTNQKLAFALFEDKIVYQNGIPTYPTGGSGVGGKFIIWWDYEIYGSQVLNLMKRDAPEVLGPGAARGAHDPILFDLIEERRESEARIAGLAARRRRPKQLPFQRDAKRLRIRQFDINKIYPLQAKREAEVKFRLPPGFREEMKRFRSSLAQRRATETTVNE